MTDNMKTDNKKHRHTQPETELINIRFYENRERQALTTTEPSEEDGKGGDFGDGVISSSSACSDHAVAVAAAPPDKSRKGSVDERILNLVNLINEEKGSFFTTSSCSGRIILYTWEGGDASGEVNSKEKLKRGCKWLLVSHDEVGGNELFKAYQKTSEEEDKTGNNLNDIYFKMEPCIFHVQCRTLSKARKLIHLATESGFRNSGMVIGKENRITVAIRSAMGLEVPLPHASCPNNFVTEEYFQYLANIGNSKIKENWERTGKLLSLFKSIAWKDSESKK